MRFALLIVLGLAAIALAAHFMAAARFAETARNLAARLETGPPTYPAPKRLPETLRAVVEAAGAGRGGPARAVRLTQDAELQLRPGAAFAPAPATQTFGLGAPGFVWFAGSPLLPGFPKVRVIDAYVGGQGRLSARALGSLPVANASGPEIARAQAMRYLAELPWVPDAILGNPAIEWSEVDGGWVEASLPLEPRAATVRLRIEGGAIVEMRAEDRPAEQGPDGDYILRDWRGLFTDHAEIGGRRIPTRGEVGYIRDGEYTPYWRGTITGYEILR